MPDQDAHIGYVVDIKENIYSKGGFSWTDTEVTVLFRATTRWDLGIRLGDPTHLYPMPADYVPERSLTPCHEDRKGST